jgi:hypothetical protein
MRTLRSILLVVAFTAACHTELPDEEPGSASFPIANGAPASKSVYPWAAFLEITLVHGESARCSGTLIDSNTILTAAHCMVCAASVDVGLLGNAPANPVGSPPASFVTVGAGNIHVNPLAYPDPISCNVDKELLFSLLNLFTHWANDIAVIELPGPAGVTSLPPLLWQQDYGFSPVQDLYGQAATLVGRGPPTVGSTDTSLMRAGQGSIDAFMPLPLFEDDFCDPLPHGFNLIMRNAAYDDPPGQAEASILPGDSGGTMMVTWNGNKRLLGVASAGDDDKLAIHAPTFLLGNSDFIAPFVNAVPPASDADGDRVPDPFDNCLEDANTDQIDRDADGVGYVCDTCFPIDEFTSVDLLTTFDGAPPSAWSAQFDPDQDNGNQEAENEAFLGSYPGYLEDGLPAHIDYLEYTQALATLFTIPCNTSMSQVVRQKRYRKGDVCDPIPHATSQVIYGPPPPEVGPPPLICDAKPPFLIATCDYEIPTALEVTPVAQGPATGTVGVRFCACDQDHETEAERRLYCGAATAADCAIDGDLYPPGDPRWKLLHVNGGTSVLDVPLAVSFTLAGSLTYVTPWNVLADMVALTGIPLPPPPWGIDTEGGIIGGPPAVPGILWTHVVSLGGQPTESLPPDGVRDVADLAGTYGELTTAIRVLFHWIDLTPPETKPPWPWEYCGPCLWDFAWLHQVGDPEKPAQIAFGPGGAIEVSAKIQPSAHKLLGSSHLRVSASETPAQLAARKTVFREVLVDGALNVKGRLGVKQAEVVGEEYEAGALRAGPLPHVLAYSAVREELYRLGVDSRGAPLLQTWSAATRAWSARGLTGVAPATVRALSFRLLDLSLYALDEPAGSPWLRLLRVDLASGRVSLVSDRFLSRDYRQVALSSDRAGGLLIGASDGDLTRFARLALGGRGWAVTDRGLSDRPLDGGVRAVRRGVLFMTPGGEHAEPVAVDFGAFEPAGPGEDGISPAL